MNACAIVGNVIPTLSVPGRTSSLTRFRSLYIEVVVANEPMPRVSKKVVTNQIAPSNGVGAIGSGLRSRLRAATQVII
jgi:hypothetical protein